MKTLYDLLEVETAATQAQIEQGYKRQLDLYLDQPQDSKSDCEMRRMQNVREAYLLLCSPQKRLIYDQQLKIFQEAKRRVFNRATLWRAALVAVGVLAAAGGLYLRHGTRSQPWGPAADGEPAVLSQVNQGGGQSGN